MYTVAAYYRFFALADPSALREELRATFAATDLLGTTLIAPEGINGTMAASAETIDRLLSFLAERTGLPRSDVKFSVAEVPPFRRQKFKLKREIITFRNAPTDPTRPGQYVDPQQWNDLLADPDVLLLDTRNTYESEIGTFKGAVAPPLANFSDFATYVRENLDPSAHRKVAMFCTGGIRCEKASAYMLQQGFPEVYHLKGGILKYLEQVPVETSQWQGDCYIFDERISVDHEDFKG
ncbi:MAG: rhodanese-related sulfurtransferase [Acidobacteriaceae bacterium]